MGVVPFDLKEASLKKNKKKNVTAYPDSSRSLNSKLCILDGVWSLLVTPNVTAHDLHCVLRAITVIVGEGVSWKRRTL